MTILPKLDFPKFGGRAQEWPKFWDAFESTVHKFKYLKMYLMEPSLTAIGGFTLTAANYNVAVDLFKQWYGKEDVIQRGHINLSPVYNDGDEKRRELTRVFLLELWYRL